MDEHSPIFGDEPSTTTPAFLDLKVEPTQTLEIRTESWESTGDRRMIHPSTSYDLGYSNSYIWRWLS